MKTKTTLLALFISAFAASLCIAADDAFMGTWKLNEAKSKIGAGKVVVSTDGKSRTVTESDKGKDGKETTTNAVYDKQ